MTLKLPMKLAAAAFGAVLAFQPAAVSGVIFSAPSVALAAPAATAAPYTYTRMLKVGCKGQDVKALQTRLKELGHYNSALDGIFGSGTANAVKAYQRASGLKADGVVGRETYGSLYQATGGGGSSGDGTGNQYTYTRVLKKGCKGQDVKALQTKLKELGYYKSVLDGVFGDGTANAVKAYQRAASLKADGIVGQATYNSLYQAASSDPAPGSGDAPADDGNKYAYTRALKVGCKGQDVKLLQTRLKELGYYTSALDGSFGSGTQAAVKAFQQAANLKADGIVGQATYGALYQDSAPEAPGSGSGSSDPSGGDYKYGALDNRVTLKSGSSGSNVKDLQTALKQKGFYTGTVTGNYDSRTKTAVMNFQRSVKLDVDGIAGNYTLSALYTMLNPPDLEKITPWRDGLNPGKDYTIEKPKWDNVKDSVFKRGLDAVVVDVRTGYTFQIRRTGGTNHADVEPLTALDTATFYKAAGNFSWDRRPIWVVVNGHRLAASMNCMPHGYDTLANNDFKGQFCIHFVDSRTHGSNKVDPDHQKAIEEAYQAGLAD